MSICSRFLRILSISIFLSVTSQSSAVIRVDVPVTAMYDVAKLVIVGRVLRVDIGEKLVELEIVRIAKGTYTGKNVQMLFVDLGDYVRLVEINQPVVIFNGVRGAQVHLADHFLSGEPLAGDKPGILRVKKVNPLQPMFPGRTVGLVRLVDEISLGRPSLLNIIEHVVWEGGIKEWGRVLPDADYVIASDLNGDGKAEVLIGHGRAIQLLVNTGMAFKDGTIEWGLQNAKGKWAAYGDIDGSGRPALLIGNQLWLNRGDRFTPGPVLPIQDNETDILTAGLLDVTGDGRPDAIFLERNGKLQVFENPGLQGTGWKRLPVKNLWNEGEDAEAASLSPDFGDTGKPHVMVVRPSGLTRYALAADGGPPASFERLTSEPLGVYNQMKNLSRWNVLGAVPLDINGDGRKDLVVILDRDGPTLVNRGFGTFFLNPLPAEAMAIYGGKEVPWKVTPGTRFGAGDLHGDKFDDLLIVTKEGRMFELNNTPYERHSDRFQ